MKTVVACDVWPIDISTFPNYLGNVSLRLSNLIEILLSQLSNPNQNV